jgi:hypothetical protein
MLSTLVYTATQCRHCKRHTYTEWSELNGFRSKIETHPSSAQASRRGSKFSEVLISSENTISLCLSHKVTYNCFVDTSVHRVFHSACELYVVAQGWSNFNECTGFNLRPTNLVGFEPHRVTDVVYIYFNCKWVFTRWQWYYNKTQHTSHKITHDQTKHSIQKYTQKVGQRDPGWRRGDSINAPALP